MKTIQLLLIGLLFSLSATAGDILELRGALGFTFASLNPAPKAFSSNSSGGMMIGGDFIFGKKWYVSSGIYYFTSSCMLKNNTSGEEDKVNFHKIKIPAYIGTRIIPFEKKLNVRLFAGPSLSYVVDVTSDKFDVNKDQLNRGLWSGNAGIGLDVLFLFADAGYEFGLSKVFKDTNIGTSKNNSFWLSAGMRFRF